MFDKKSTGEVVLWILIFATGGAFWLLIKAIGKLIDKINNRRKR